MAPSPRRARPPRRVTLVYVARRDAAPRLSLAYCLLVRALQEQTHAPTTAAEDLTTLSAPSACKEVGA